LGGHFDLDIKLKKIEELENKLNSPNIWDDASYANQISAELTTIKKSVIIFQDVQNNLTSYRELLNEFNDEEMVNEIELKIEELDEIIDNLEISNLLNGKYDGYNCYLEIHPGAGGTEACDWADILNRMYQMFCNKHDYKFEIIDYQAGDEAGIKTIIMKIIGNYPYGYFKGEQGVHRLVRISPFDSNARRHTSFAAVSVIPEIDTEINIEIKPDDIRVDVYRASGKGGQGVNTTDSAVRLTHIPSGLVVTCQNERSQIKNKEQAMKVLISKLEQKAFEKQNEQVNSMKGHQNIEFGSQIRNYTLEPYRLVKDTRTGYETSNTEAVLNGNIIPFMQEYLKMRR